MLIDDVLFAIFAPFAMFFLYDCWCHLRAIRNYVEKSFWRRYGGRV